MTEVKASNSVDPCSFANLDEARVKNFHLVLTADFDKKVLHGYVDVTVQVLTDGCKRFCLDTNNLKIGRVTSSGKELKASVGDRKHAVFGSALDIETENLGSKKGSEFVVRVEYSTTAESTAVQWLPPSATAGKVHPYLFTQCQAIHARSLLPCQDTPGIKTPWKATITVPAPLVALCSAKSTGKQASSDGKSITYEFDQPVLMPSYLVAIAIGALESRSVGPRSAVWSEKETVEAGAYEFAETEKFITACENICGPYVWGRYDILLLPPSFPYGGMENPCLTFVTPTLLAGDRSLANVVAHEAAHSWMGNLVTAQNWEHFWLNEGYCVFLERHVMRALHGDKFMNLHAVIGGEDLKHSINEYGLKHPYTALWVKLKDVDPDDAFSSIPYEKGFQFLWYLQRLVGGPDIMLPYLKAYCQRFNHACVTSESMREHFLSYFKDKVDAKKLAEIDWETWFHQPGMPPVDPNFDTSLVDAAHQLAKSLSETDAKNAKPDDIKGWSSNQTVVFLERLQQHQKEQYEAAKTDVTACKTKWAGLLERMDAVYKFSATKNSEIRFRWLTTCVRADMKQVFDDATAFLTSQGRMKFTRPLYRELYRSAVGKELAVATFKKHSAMYHSICAKMVGKDLELGASSS